MGSVYDVEDVTVGKRYVLKTLHPQLVSREDLAKRMEAEARALAKLQHPNIVDVVTAGMTTDAARMPFYVMERLNGQNLRVVIEKKGSLELSHCYRIAIDVLDALEHAHENSVIHRDVKPDNIFLHRNANGTTTTKLLDFGIMRLLDRKMSHTQGKFIGTLRYASPEQIFGGELGPATDIYSLGLVLYEMLAGRGPFDDLGDAYAIGAAHAQRPPPSISQFASVPAPLERLVMSALAKAPHDRPRDCFSFASDLRRMLRDDEAAPKSATAVNVLTSAAPNTIAALAGTEASPPPGAPPGPVSGARTDVGMVPPSALAHADAGGLLPPTVRQGASGSGVAAPVAMGPTAMGVAPTLMSEPGGETGRAMAAAARAGSGSGSGGRAPIDRAAETRASGVSGFTQRLAMNGTAIDDGPVAVHPDDAVRAALAQRAPLEVPPASGAPHDAASQEIVFPRGHGFATGTGPLSGEARTRPPERGLLLPLVAAAVFAAALVGGAVLFVTKPWAKRASVAAASSSSPMSTPLATAGEAPVAAAGSAANAPVAPVAAPLAPVPGGPITPVGAAAPTAQVTQSPVPRQGAAPVVAVRGPAAAVSAVSAPTHTAPAAAPASAAHKPVRPAAASPRPEDVGFE